MRVLFVVPYPPSLIRTRSYNLIRHLSARGARVVVATLWSDRRELEDVERLRGECAAVHAVQLPAWRSMLNCVRALPGAQPLQSVYSWSAALRTLIDRLVPDADVVHVEHLRGARYALHASRQRGRRVPVVWDSVDCISYLFEQAVRNRTDRAGRLVNGLELSRTRRYEGWLAPQFDRVVITSETDRRAMLALVPPAAGALPDITVVPNGVDTSYFAPAGDRREPQSLVFSGKMSYHANVSAALHLVSDIMPLVWKTLPDVRLQIVGKDPPAVLTALAERHAPLVSVTGTVPDVRPFLRRASVAAIPLVYGAGSQFKVLEAMACGTPVIATPQAASALDALPGRDVVVAQGPQAFAREVVDLLREPARQRAIGEAGRRYVEATHRWDAIAARLQRVYEETIAGGRSRIRHGAPAMPATDRTAGSAWQSGASAAGRL